jgi:hypothetical protein
MHKEHQDVHSDNSLAVPKVWVNLSRFLLLPGAVLYNTP